MTAPELYSIMTYSAQSRSLGSEVKVEFAGMGRTASGCRSGNDIWFCPQLK